MTGKRQKKVWPQHWKSQKRATGRKLFSTKMGHEIRAPMNSMLGFSNLLQGSYLSDDQHQKYIEIIKKSGERMLTTISALMNISVIASV